MPQVERATNWGHRGGLRPGQDAGVIACGGQAISSEEWRAKGRGEGESGERWAEQTSPSVSDWLCRSPCLPMGFLSVPALSPGWRVDRCAEFED